MMKFLLSSFFIATVATAYTQDSISHRIIFVGDAGEIDNQQNNVIGSAAQKVLPNKTTVVYVGDNVYPTGMGLPGSKEEEQTKNILRAQYQPMRGNNAAVYFLPGNHDWDRMGGNGLAKMKAQWRFIDQQNDSLLKVVPPDGCPGPYEISINDHIVIIAFDSEWWLFKHDKTNAEADCDCNTNDEVISKLEELFYKNRYKTILLADHHPFKSYGHHGGYYGWKDHIFPLTAANKSLYVPMPIVGSLYPLLRKLFANPEDAIHPWYKDMISRVNNVFDTFPNLVHVAGHEHGMQFIKEANNIQVVSGAGAKEAFVKKGKHSMYAQKAPGYVVADQLLDYSVRFTYYVAETDSGFKNVFSYTFNYTPIKQLEEAAINNIPDDSTTVATHPSYDSVSGFHRWLFGENYRKEWSVPTTLPVIKISAEKGGLTPTQRGGGHQSYSLRLEDKDGKEYVLRSVNKYPEVLLPQALRQTFAGDWINDAMSAQHPYSALIVPPLADAANVPHTNPEIGWVAPDKKLGIYANTFANTVNLLEEREPEGESDKTEKMMRKLIDDNDNNFDTALFLRARLLDVLINDWDRHNDQWRFAYNKNNNGGKTYFAVPRDRDQVFYVNEGLLPGVSSLPWFLWFMQDYKKLRSINDFMWESRDLNSRFLNQLDHAQWMNIVNDFVTAENDSVLNTALKRLPASAYNIRYSTLLKNLQNRRAVLPKAFDEYYFFLNKIVDIQTSDKNELVEIKDTLNNNVLVSIHKLSKERNVKQQLYYKSFDPSITKEIRLYVNDGNDSIVFNTSNRRILIRVIGRGDNKTYNVEQVNKKPIIYNYTNNVNISGDANKLRRHFSNDSANTAYIPVDLYNRWQPLLVAGYNIDDGIILGAGFKYTHKGFRKTPWANVQQFGVGHSFSTRAFRIVYSGEWKDAVGKADLLLNGVAKAPDNTQNFFGAGNETAFDKTGDYKKYYRARFDLYTANAALRWGNKTSVTIGPSFQYYRYDADENKGRFIEHISQLNTYDSAVITDDKFHLGAVINFTSDSRDNKMLPTFGAYINVRMQSYAGLNDYSNAFTQIIPQVAVYKSITNSGSVVLANRLGGGVTFGKPAFYQLLFLDGKDNLSGYRQYRFAGQQMLYNNTEMRIKVADIASYVLPGQFGLLGFFDVGRVWVDNENSAKWHNGFGGGIYFAPAQLFLLRATLAYSEEGWYPYISFGFRF
ncbi:BamA/TamA family outer membrane protein [Parafilimonas terrae]|nr:BamA/TamA family outer membrane protein [Parafilimonas terrae]